MPALLVLVEREDAARAQANGEDRLTDHGRNDSFEAAAVERQFRFEDRPVVIHHRPLPRSDGVHRAGRLGGKNLADGHEAFAHPLGPQHRIGIQKDVFGARIVQQTEHDVAQFTAKLGLESLSLLVLNTHS